MTKPPTLEGAAVARSTSVEDDLLELTRFSQSTADWSSSPLSRDELLARAGVSVPGSAYVLLRYIEQSSSLSVSGLAQLVGLHPSTVSTQLRPLLHDDLVRSAPDDKDRRVTRLSVTPKGIRACARVREQGARNWGAVLAGWSPEDLHRLATLLRRVRADVQRTVAMVSVDDAEESWPARLWSELAARGHQD